MSPAEVVEAQISAFNAKDYEAFLAMYAEDVCVYDMPHAKPVLVGKAAPGVAYKPALSNPAVRAEIQSRMIVGNKVVDHERVIGFRPETYDVVAVYEVHESRIKAMWFFKSNDVSYPPDVA